MDSLPLMVSILESLFLFRFVSIVSFRCNDSDCKSSDLLSRPVGSIVSLVSATRESLCCCGKADSSLKNDAEAESLREAISLSIGFRST